MRSTWRRARRCSFTAARCWGPLPRPISGDSGTYKLTFANVDDRLTLWVDGKLPFGEGLTYQTERRAPHSDCGGSGAGARIGARKAAIEVDGLMLKRDAYYTIEPAEMRLRELRRCGSHRFHGVLRASVGSRTIRTSSSTTSPVTMCWDQGAT